MSHRSIELARRLVTAGALCICATAQAQMSAEELAKQAQNPVGNLISLPFQNNTNFKLGPYSGTQNILNIQPVIPIHVNALLPVNTQIGTYYNVVHPDNGANWQVRFQVQLMFPS